MTCRCAARFRLRRRLQDPLAELVKIDPKVHRRGPVPARSCRQKQPRRNADRRCGGLCQPGGRRPQHRVRVRCWRICPACPGPLWQRTSWPTGRRTAPLQQRQQLKKVAEAGPKGLRAVRRAFMRILRRRRSCWTTPRVHPETLSRRRRSCWRCLGIKQEDVALWGSAAGLSGKSEGDGRGKGHGSRHVRRSVCPPCDDIVEELSKPGRDVAVTSCRRPCCARTCWI